MWCICSLWNYFRWYAQCKQYYQRCWVCLWQWICGFSKSLYSLYKGKMRVVCESLKRPEAKKLARTWLWEYKFLSLLTESDVTVKFGVFLAFQYYWRGIERRCLHNCIFRYVIKAFKLLDLLVKILMNVSWDRTLALIMPTVLISKVLDQVLIKDIIVFVTLVTLEMVRRWHLRIFQTQQAVKILMSVKITKIIVMKTLNAIINQLAITVSVKLDMKDRVIWTSVQFWKTPSELDGFRLVALYSNHLVLVFHLACLNSK